MHNLSHQYIEAMDLSSIRKLVAEAKLDKALVELLNYAQGAGAEEICDALRIVTGKHSKGKKDSMLGLTTNQEWMQIQAQVSYAVLDFIKQLEELGPTVSLGTGNSSMPGEPCKRVFISYNHADAAEAQKLKTALREAGLEVIIDEEAMAAGADISEFIRQSVVGSDVTLSLVSDKSLLSGWVGMETIYTFYLSKFKEGKKFIACYKDDSFMKDRFVLDAGKKLNAELKELDELIAEYTAEGFNYTNLMPKKTRLTDLRNNLHTIIDKLNGSLTLDINESSWARSLEKIIQTIKA